MANEFKAKNGLITPVVTSTVTTGTVPIVVTSTTLCTNLNADLLDGQQGSAYALLTDVTDAGLTTTDVTTNNVSITKHGFCPKAPNTTTDFLRGDGTWATPSGGGNSFGTIVVSGQSNVVAETSNDSLTLIAGSGITLTTDATGDSVTITGSGGGATITNNITTNASYYPLTSTTTSGASTTVYTSNTKFYFNPSTGNLSATQFTSLSDENKKKDIHTIEDALDKVLQLRGVNFSWKDTGEKSTGVIAQEVEQILPEVVSMSDTGEKSVGYGNIVGVLIEAIKEQQKQINDLRRLDSYRGYR